MSLDKSNISTSLLQTNISAFRNDISGYDSNECLSRRQKHCGYFIHQVGVTKMNNIFHVHGEKKTTQQATEQRYRLVNYTKNTAGNLPFTLKIY
jgi:hypothetical protein